MTQTARTTAKAPRSRGTTDTGETLRLRERSLRSQHSKGKRLVAAPQAYLDRHSIGLDNAHWTCMYKAGGAQMSY
eukprot:scaffold1440_cov114-Isochrysis_galbana.AAC.2